MSIDITEKQHYVWRRYLSSWQDDINDYRIWAGLLMQRQVKKLGLKDVAQSRYFYKLEELTDSELSYLKQYASLLSCDIQELATLIISGYELYTSIKRTIATGKVSISQEELHELKKIETNVFESIHSQIEPLGNELLKCKTSNDIKDLAKEQEYDLLFFLLVQYMRTKTRKDSFSSALSERPELRQIAQKCWPFFHIITAMQWVEGFSKKKDYRFELVRNYTNTPFITGDQPALNSRWKETDAEGNITGLEIYYPMSPDTALVLAFNQGEKFCDTNADVEFVKEKNQMILEEAGLFVFANDEAVLREVMGVNDHC